MATIELATHGGSIQFIGFLFISSHTLYAIGGTLLRGLRDCQSCLPKAAGVKVWPMKNLDTRSSSGRNCVSRSAIHTNDIFIMACRTSVTTSHRSSGLPSSRKSYFGRRKGLRMLDQHLWNFGVFRAASGGKERMHDGHMYIALPLQCLVVDNATSRPYVCSRRTNGEL